jgi:hypothetical protein
VTGWVAALAAGEAAGHNFVFCVLQAPGLLSPAHGQHDHDRKGAATQRSAVIVARDSMCAKLAVSSGTDLQHIHDIRR